MRPLGRVISIAAVWAALLGLLSAVAWYVLSSASQRWWERDVNLRGELALSGPREVLERRWGAGDHAYVASVLTSITRDERILGAAACRMDGSTVAVTPAYPPELDCAALSVRKPPGRSSWRQSVGRRADRVHVAIHPLGTEEAPLGFISLVHDLSFVDRRESALGRYAFLMFGLLAVAAAGITVGVVRLTRRHWFSEAHAAVRGVPTSREFQPLLSEVRELAHRIAAESDPDSDGKWTSARLRQTLRRYLEGERVVVLANREPYIHERGADGATQVLHPASGLVTALEPVMRACSGVWVAHGSGSADRATVDSHDRVWVPPGENAFQIRRVWLGAAEERGFYYGFANEGLWPLCHLAHNRPVFRSEDWRHYRAVNQRFADVVCDEVDSEDPIVLVQDYHFTLAPQMIRARLPRATILTFLHIPWPNAEQLGICPYHDDILRGLLGSSIVGFHTQRHCNNFIEGIDRFLEARIDREERAVVQGGRSTLVRPYPISLEWPSQWSAEAPAIAECRRSVRAELDLPPDTLLGVGIDRLDYTKGIEERLLAVERLLELRPELRGRFTFVQLAAPSRTRIERYRELNERVAAVAERISARFQAGRYRPIILHRAHHEPPTVFRYYRAADLCYVSSLHDGMNLVAKEFVAARDDEHGVLVLSEFTGAARELPEALIVNPYDIEQAARGLGAALAMPASEQVARMRAMRAMVSEFNVYRWAGRMLVDGARMRGRERLSGRLTQPVHLNAVRSR